MEKFEREDRYIVIKRSDLDRAGMTTAEGNALRTICDRVTSRRKQLGKAPLECVIVESDWPEYGPTWAAIEARMSQQSEQEQGHE